MLYPVKFDGPGANLLLRLFRDKLAKVKMGMV